MTLARHARGRSFRALVLLAFAASGCGAAPAPLQAPAAPSAAAPVLAPSPPDLAAVPEPPTLILSGRVARPSAVLAAVHTWSRLPMPQSDEVGELVIGDAVGPIADLDQPIDFAIAVVGSGMRTRGRAAVSVGLKDVERAKAVLADRYKLVNGDNGAILIQGVGRARHPDGEDEDDDDRGDEERRSCEIAPAIGSPPWRLICGWGPKSLVDLAPWLARTATRATIPADAHVDLRLAPMRGTLTAEKRLFSGLVATAVASRVELPSARDLAMSVAGDLVDFAIDLDSASIDLDLGDRGAAAAANVRFAGETASLTRLATANPDRDGPAPDAFLSLPADADFAIFDRGVDEREIARARDLLLHVLGDGLSEYGLKEADRKPILDAFAKMMTSAPLVYASGIDVDTAGKAVAAARAVRDSGDAAAIAEADRAEAEALLGWRLVEIEEPSTRWVDALKDLSAAVSKPAFGAAYRARVPKGTPPALRSATPPKAVPLPQGTVHYVLDVYPIDASSPVAAPNAGSGAAPSSGATAAKAKAPPPRKPIGFDVFVVPDGGHTWIGLGGGDVLVASKIAAAIGPTGDKLGARAELAALKAGPVGAGGFFTPRALPEAGPQIEALLGTPHALATLFDDITKLPSHGATPIAFSVTARADAASGGASRGGEGADAGAASAGPPPVTLSLNVPRAAIEDVVAAILRHGAF